LRRALLSLWLLLSFAGSLRANVVLDWNALMLDAIRGETTGPTLSTRNLAFLSLASYEAVNSILRTHQPYATVLPAAADASTEAAVIAAGREVMLALYPTFSARTEDLYQTSLATLPAAVSTTNGLAVGVAAAQFIIALRSADGSQTEVTYVPSSAPGQWQRTPPFYRPPLTPHWRYVTPFCVSDPLAFQPPPPPALDSPEYAAALNEVKLLGAKTGSTRTVEQSQIAVFWSDFSYTAMPPGHWHEITAAIVRSRGTSLADSARLFALLSLAQADAAIVCWEAKFRWNLWRPITAIQRAGEDGNPLTDADPAWDNYLASPPFPAYMSGHSTFSKASAQVLTRFFGTDAISFTARSDALPGVFRSFTSLAACADEIGLSRIYGGIHFQFDNVAGKQVGARIGEFVSANFLLPHDSLPLVRLEGVTNGNPVLRLHAKLGGSIILDRSADLRTWIPVATNLPLVGGVLANDPAATGLASVFYRLRQ
jgi:hypothetical protein